jgi:glycosyltransferase involved in cell wall biosynthesis
LKVSVIIPNYNHAAFLHKRIESVLKQTYTDIELIILDDVSTDKSVEIINSYKHHPLISHIILNNENSGSTFKQWEKGIALARGKYIWMAESDDYADMHFLEEAITSLETNKNAGLFFCDYHVVNDKDEIITPGQIYRESLISYFHTHATMNGNSFAEDNLFIDNWLVNASAIVFKKDLFLSAGNAYLNYKIVGDWRMWTDICLQTDVIFCNQKLNFFRSHANTVRSKTASILAKETISIYTYFLTKTSKPYIKLFLKNRICELWFKSVESNRQLGVNIKLLGAVLIADPFFFMRAGKQILKSIYLKLK